MITIKSESQSFGYHKNPVVMFYQGYLLVFFALFYCTFCHVYINNHDTEEHIQRDKRAVDMTDEYLQNLSPLDRPNCKQGAKKPRTQVDTSNRLSALRSLFAREGIGAYLIPSEDAHQSEYTSEYDSRRKFISGFSGSAGYAVVFADRAALWTDGRYFLQAEDQLDCNWILMKDDRRSVNMVPTLNEYVISILKTSVNKTLGASPFLVSSGSWVSRNKSLAEKGIQFKQIQSELIDEVWTSDNGRPAQPSSVINALPIEFSGRTWQDKILNMHTEMEKKSVDAMVVTGLDETAWLFNLRASDILYNPFFISYATIERANNRTRLYLIDHTRKLTEDPDDIMTKVKVADHLNTGLTGSCSGKSELCVEVKRYNNTDLLNDIDRIVAASTKVWIPSSCNYAIYSRIPEDKLHQALTPIAYQKAKKNSVERTGLKNAHIRDAVALIKFITKLEKEVQAGKRWTEVSAADELRKYRSQQMHNRGVSFHSISSSGPNGAVIHYTPSLATDRQITTSDMYLLDSGGQYLDGTTDVTRTFHFGTPTAFEKECYTRVLMGHIDLANVRWPNYLYGRSLDVLARRHLWKVGLRYRHGTGHGIGSYLSVHEGPGFISVSSSRFDTDSKLDEGQFFSDEPGYYEDGKFGVRHESIIMVKKSEDKDLKYSFPDTTFLEFEDITLVPFEPHLIQYDLLNDDQIEWLNHYNKQIVQKIAPRLKDDAEAYNWLMRRVQVISKNGISSGKKLSPEMFLFILMVFSRLFYSF